MWILLDRYSVMMSSERLNVTMVASYDTMTA